MLRGGGYDLIASLSEILMLKGSLLSPDLLGDLSSLSVMVRGCICVFRHGHISQAVVCESTIRPYRECPDAFGEQLAIARSGPPRASQPA